MTLLRAGATALIGHAVMAPWAAAVPGGTLHALVRRPLAAVPSGLQPLVVDFSGLLPAAWRPIAGVTVARTLRQALRTAPAGVQGLDNARLYHAGPLQQQPA